MTQIPILCQLVTNQRPVQHPRDQHVFETQNRAEIIILDLFQDFGSRLTFLKSNEFKLLSSFATVKIIASCGFQLIPFDCIFNVTFFIGVGALTSYSTIERSDTVEHKRSFSIGLKRTLEKND